MLKYAADARTLSFACACACSFFAQWLYRRIDDEGPVCRMCFLVPTAFLAFQQAVAVHNYAHCAVFRDRTINDAFGVLLTLLSGAPTSLYVPGHNATHHRHLETTEDVMRTSRMTYEREWLNILLFFPTIALEIMAHDLAYMRAQRAHGTSLYRRFRREAVAYHALLACLAYADPRKTLWVYVLPTTIGKYMIVTLNMLQHRGCDPDSRYDHSRNFTGVTLNYLLFNNGYHTQHHNAAGMHWSLLKDEHARIEHEIREELLCDSLLRYLWAQMRRKRNAEGLIRTLLGFSAHGTYRGASDRFDLATLREKSRSDTQMIWIYAGWCGHCTTFDRTWSEAIQRDGNDHRWHKIDNDDDANAPILAACGRIQYLPFVAKMHDGVITPFVDDDANNKRDLQQLLAFSR